MAFPRRARLPHADAIRCVDLNSNKQYRALRIFGTFGEMMPLQETAQVGSLIDGGYFENEGLQTTLELAEWLGRQSPGGRSVRPIIVQATGDGEANVTAADVMTCDIAS